MYNSGGNIPAPLAYGTVTGRFISVLADSGDTGDEPDVVYLNGTVTISPLAKVYRITDSFGVTSMVVSQDIVASVVNGQLLSPDGRTALTLLASNSPGMSPAPLQYSAKFSLNGVNTQPPQVTFNVPINDTVDLSSGISLPSVPPVQTIVVGIESLLTENVDGVINFTGSI
jgi:hypothetical protein